MEEIRHKANVSVQKFTTSVDRQEWIIKFDDYIISSMPTDKLEKLLAMVQGELDNRKK